MPREPSPVTDARLFPSHLYYVVVLPTATGRLSFCLSLGEKDGMKVSNKDNNGSSIEVWSIHTKRFQLVFGSDGSVSKLVLTRQALGNPPPHPACGVTFGTPVTEVLDKT